MIAKVKQGRMEGLDILKCISCIGVVSLHIFQQGEGDANGIAFSVLAILFQSFYGKWLPASFEERNTTVLYFSKRSGCDSFCFLVESCMEPVSICI